MSLLNHFTDDISKEIIPLSHSGNVVMSPLSLATSLGMTLLAAKGSTRSELASALRLPAQVPQVQVDAFFEKIISKATSMSAIGYQKILMYNKMLLAARDPPLPLLPRFEDGLTKYNASAEVVNFRTQAKAITDDVNSWISNKTQGLIPTLFDEPLPNDTAYLIVNTLYFQGLWVSKFRSEEEISFLLEDGSRKATKFMDQRSELKYLKLQYGQRGDGVELVVSPYQGNNASMVFLLPSSNLSVNKLFNSRMITSMVQKVIQEGEVIEMDLYVPKVNFKSTLKMKEYLVSLGARTMFSRSWADFSAVRGESRIYVDAIHHATAIEIDEEGTKAASSTGVVFRESSWTFQLKLNRPFAFVIYDDSLRVPLFVGKVASP